MSACVIAAGSAALPAYADNDTDDMEFGGNYAIVDEAEYQEYLDSLTDEQRQFIEAKEQMLTELMNESSETYMSGRAAMIGLSKPFTIYSQKESIYCGPACVQSVLKYITGDSPEQEEIHDVIQRNFYAIPGYIASIQTKFTYSKYGNPSETALVNCIKTDVANFDVPTFIRIAGTTTTSWYYRTDGHCILSTGVSDDLSTIQIADPLVGLVPDCPGFYSKSAYLVSLFTTDICW